MAHAVKPVKVGSIKITSEELEALRILRDYKRLREAAGWSSSMVNKEASVLKDLLGDSLVSRSRNERTTKQRHVTQLPFARYGY